MSLAHDLGLLARLKLRVFRYVHIRDEQREGWSEALPIYLFRCPVHGLVESPAHGYEGRLDCPQCLREEREENEGDEKDQT
jgi:hypothetical protein